jgi:hypothetical protein
MNQDWFEMKDIIKKRLETTVWIPLRKSLRICNSNQSGTEGFQEEFIGVGSVAFSLDDRAEAENLNWSDIGLRADHHPYVQDEKYFSADQFHRDSRNLNGVHLVLKQRGNSAEYGEWHLHQDITIGLGLKREGDIWVCPNEGYVEVVKLFRDADDHPNSLEIKSEFLKDFLCARKMALYVTSYRHRVIISGDKSPVDWTEAQTISESRGQRWQGRIFEIHEGGHPFGEKMAVFHMSRIDIENDEDVPILGPENEENTKSKSWTKGFSGKLLYRIEGELWKNEWVEPSEKSPRIREDDSEPMVYFITNVEGKKEKKETLEDGGKWLWFNPAVMMALAHRRGGFIKWYTAETGEVGCSPDYGVSFGINKLGYINVFAHDIVLLPEWQQQIWVAYNISPDGGVSEELLDSQVRAEPASTQAPEPFLIAGLSVLKRVASDNIGISILNSHDEIDSLLSKCHRFRAIDIAGLFALAKDLARITADSFNISEIQKIAPPPKGNKLGSLKSLEALLTIKIGEKSARKIMGPFFGIYELRLADAHLPGEKVSTAMDLVGIDQTEPLVFQSHSMLRSCVSSLYAIIGIFKKWKDE